MVPQDALAVVMRGTAPADVDNRCTGHVDDPPSFLSQPGAEIGLFEIKEVRFIKQKEPDRFPAHQKAGTLQTVDIVEPVRVFVKPAVTAEDM